MELLERFGTLLQIIIIPILAWIIAIERRLSILEGKIDMLIRMVNDEKRREDTK
jgi:hypothetical protein